MKALLAHPQMVAQLDPEGLVEYLTFQNFFTDRTLFAGVRLLPAGSVLQVAVGDQNIGSSERYWDFRFRIGSAAIICEALPIRMR